jgi:hypothetical protein
MRGNEKKKERKVRSVTIEKADNGHSVRVNHEYHEGMGLDDDKPKVFQDGNEDEMVDHALKALGVKHNKKDDENGEAGDCNGKCPSCCK